MAEAQAEAARRVNHSEVVRNRHNARLNSSAPFSNAQLPPKVVEVADKAVGAEGKVVEVDAVVEIPADVADVEAEAVS